MKSQRFNFRLTIKEISLTKKSYPFNFFIRVTSQSTGHSWDSPIILINKFEESE